MVLEERVDTSIIRGSMSLSFMFGNRKLKTFSFDDLCFLCEVGDEVIC